MSFIYCSQKGVTLARSTGYRVPSLATSKSPTRVEPSSKGTGRVGPQSLRKNVSLQLPKARSRSIRSAAKAPKREFAETTPTTTKLIFLLVCDAFNSMAQRALLALQERGHSVVVHEFRDGESMVAMVAALKPDVILCPFLTKRIPREVYAGEVPCLVVHPGVEGDRGMSSIDWALQEAEPEWGVTILQAEEEMDAGPIWATSNFEIRREFGGEPTKSSLYRIECVDAAMRCLEDVLHNLAHNVPPRPLNYDAPHVRGRLRPKLTQANRRLDWTLPAEDLARIIRASDSQPGTVSIVANEKFLLFGAHVESNPPENLSGMSNPMEIVGHRDGAVLIRCGFETALWITHLKRTVKSIKLPATTALPSALVASLPLLPANPLELPFNSWPTTHQEIFYWNLNDVTYLWFDFYNGAMSTDQCRRLTAALDHIEDTSDSKVLVLMGGVNYFSNGIHLNTIESARDPARESWENINAIDDVVLRILTCSKRVTVSAMVGSAGAGGVMAAIAADQVWAHRNVVLHPSYKPMALYGSEYWTHSLPRRVGAETAGALLASTDPVSAAQAHQIGLIDEILLPSAAGFFETVVERAERISQGAEWGAVVAAKASAAVALEAYLHQCRHHELAEMRVCFESEVYHQRRRDFVYKSAGSLSCQAELHQPMQQVCDPAAGVLVAEDVQIKHSCSFKFPMQASC